jgi:hypothetical protein
MTRKDVIVSWSVFAGLVRALGMSNAGHRKLLRIYWASQAMENGHPLPPGILIITSILNAEFGPSVSDD